MVESALPIPGEIIAGKYRIESIIGQGGMGVVLGAFDQSLGRQVAIKFLHPSRAANEGAAARFSREARAAASIQGEHVVRVHEVGQLANGAPFIVMEHLRGSDLAQIVQHRGGLPVDYACDLVLQTCQALAQAHARGIVHRDLKPQNLFLTERADGSPCVKVLDFGISKAADTDESSPKLTSTEMVMGTPLYMSPEQVRSLKNVDHRADIWALGAILFELLAAKPPFDGPSASALHAAIAMDAPASLRARRPDVPPHIDAAILRCLEKDPARRFQTVQELSAAIAPGRVTSASGSNPVIVSVSPPAGGFGTASTMDVRSGWQQATVPQPMPKSSNTGLIIGGIAGGALLVLLAIGGAAAYFLSRTATAVSVTETPVTPPATTVPAMTADPPVVPTAPAPAPAPPPTASAKPVAPKDAGPPPPSQDDRDRALATTMQGSCDHFHMMMSMAKTPDERKHQADMAKLQNCITRPAIRCQRQVCREACTILNDEFCRQNVDRLDHDFPAKY
jgi:serine/threonine-protein kinase